MLEAVALEDLGRKWFAKLAREHPELFVSLMMRLLPKPGELRTKGDEAEPIRVIEIHHQDCPAPEPNG